MGVHLRNPPYIYHIWSYLVRWIFPAGKNDFGHFQARDFWFVRGFYLGIDQWIKTSKTFDRFHRINDDFFYVEKRWFPGKWSEFSTSAGPQKGWSQWKNEAAVGPSSFTTYLSWTAKCCLYSSLVIHLQDDQFQSQSCIYTYDYICYIYVCVFIFVSSSYFWMVKIPFLLVGIFRFTS